MEKLANFDNISADQKSLKQYWLFFSGQLFSLFGSSVVQFAIIWWLTITSKTQYPDQTGLILALASVAGFAPFVLTNLFAGVLVDRWNRKLVIGIADAIQALITIMLLVAFVVGQATIPVVLIILAIRAVAQGFHQPASQAIIILMVPRNKLTAINSYQYLFTGLINLVGPVIGAFVIEIIGVENLGIILWLDVISFLVAVIPLSLISIPDITKAKRESGEKGKFFAEFKEGINFITGTKGLLALQLSFTIVNVISTPTLVLLPLVAISPVLLSGNATTLGLILAGFQIGSIVGSFVLTRKKIFAKNVHGVITGFILLFFSTFILIFSASNGNLYGVIIASAIDGLAMPMANVHSQNIWQQVVPPELQGRVMSVRQTISWLMIPIAQIIGGYLSDVVGLIALYYGSAILGSIVIICVWFMTSLKQVEQLLEVETEVIVDKKEANNVHIN